MRTDDAEATARLTALASPWRGDEGRTMPCSGRLVDSLLAILREKYKTNRGENRGNAWAHGWAIATLLFAGKNFGFDAIPEYEVTISTRSGRGQCDVVWCRNEKPIYAFEVGFSHGKPRELAKLLALERLGAKVYMVQLGRHGIKRSNIRKSKELRFKKGRVQ